MPPDLAGWLLAARTPAGRRDLWRIVREPLVFGIVGVISTLIYLAISLLCARWLELTALPSSIIGHTIATVWSFLGHHRLTFQRDGQYGYYGRRFFVLMVLNYLANMAIVHIVSVWLGYSDTASFLAVALLIPGFSYLVSKFWVFRTT